jgi:hypothetical protein
MGKYINETSKGVIGLSAVDKIAAIRADNGIIIPEPKEWLPNLVYVANNGLSGVAKYVDTPEEFKQIYTPYFSENVWMLWWDAKKYAE